MEIPKDYPLVVGTALAMSWQCWRQGFQVGATRRKVFNKDFMEKEFGEVHRAEVGEEIQGGGYPDTGSGLYSQKLSYSYDLIHVGIGINSMCYREFT